MAWSRSDELPLVPPSTDTGASFAASKRRSVGGSSRARRKRADILRAARQLFLDGYDRVSTDAVAAAAGVSKRTVYDYFGDKRSLFQHVIAQEQVAVLQAVQLAIEEEVRDDRPLEEALITFARRILRGPAGSDNYAALRRLSAHGPAAEPVVTPPSPMAEPEQFLADRFAVLVERGRLQAPDPRRAAEHFAALTLLLALEHPDATLTPLPRDVDDTVVEGVRAFLRAYPPRDAPEVTTRQ